MNDPIMHESKYQWQDKALEYTEARLADKRAKTLIAAPTGTGKSYFQKRLQDRYDDMWLLTPRIEIIRGHLQKRGYDTNKYNNDQLIMRAKEYRICTPIRFKNMLLSGEVKSVKYLNIDEVHHHLADTYQIIEMLTDVPTVGATASPYRGTTKQTAEFLRIWGHPYWGISYQAAVAQGLILMPMCHIEGLIDDDLIQIVNGEFQIEALESEINDRLDDAIKLIRAYWDGDSIDIPTMISVPSKRIANVLHRRLTQLNIESRCIVEDTNEYDRQLAFQTCLNCTGFLIQIEVVSEGVDLPIRRLIDLKPTMSPVKWLQSIGRIMRPGNTIPHYICTNRNLMRHGYLLEGLIPVSKYIESEQSFPKKTTRYLGYRAIGLEAFGRFKPTNVKMANGLDAIMYNLASLENGKYVQYAIIIHPMITHPLIAKKESDASNGIEFKWGKWRICDVPNDLKGFQSATPKVITTKQKAWWDRMARHMGLDERVTPDAKQFQVLPILVDLQRRIV